MIGDQQGRNIERTRAPKFEVVRPIIKANNNEKIIENSRIGLAAIILNAPLTFDLNKTYNVKSNKNRFSRPAIKVTKLLASNINGLNKPALRAGKNN
jgi:hypothetical protein